MFTGLALSLVLTTASAPPPPGQPITRHIERTAATFAGSSPGQPSQPPARDSLKNGAVIGAVIGGIVTGAGIGLLCHAFNDTDEPICWKATLLWAGIGAGGGAAIGAGVDALFARGFTVRAAVRF